LKHYCQNADQVLTQTDSCREGLSSAEAQKRLDANGKNKLAESKKDSILVQFLKQLTDPMIIILSVVIINAVLGVYQENKAEKAIEALQEMSAATSKVLRDGKIVSIRSEELVIGDAVPGHGLRVHPCQPDGVPDRHRSGRSGGSHRGNCEALPEKGCKIIQ